MFRRQRPRARETHGRQGRLESQGERPEENHPSEGRDGIVWEASATHCRPYRITVDSGARGTARYLRLERVASHPIWYKNHHGQDARPRATPARKTGSHRELGLAQALGEPRRLRVSRRLIASPRESSLRYVRVDVRGPAGRLEALFETPPSPVSPPWYAILTRSSAGRWTTTPPTGWPRRYSVGEEPRCDSTSAESAEVPGCTTRVTGRSTTSVSALAWLAEREPNLPRYACGFSFGSWMALEATCLEPSVRGVLCAGVPISLRALATGALQRCPVPVAVVQGEYDEHGSPEEIRKTLDRAAGPRRLAVVRGAGHLFGEDLQGLEREANLALAWLAEATP